MGSEKRCKVQWGGRSGPGKALLESGELIFRGEFALKIPFSSIRTVTVRQGRLRVETGTGAAVFHLGADAEKWREKILHPKSRLEKLGVKPSSKLCLRGEFPADFLRELTNWTGPGKRTKVAAGSDLIFFAPAGKADLAALAGLSRALAGSRALWVVYPKGQKALTENDVISRGRKAGLKDLKVVGFSATHTALKFVNPREKR